ncbi:MAG: hypothetical protein AAGA54_21560 [Myxococcota bacterium]
MATSTLDTRHWNLTAATVIAALGVTAPGCGPAVEFDDEQTETEGGSASASDTIIDPSETETNPTSPTSPTTSPTGPTGCDDGGIVCQPNEVCVDNRCVDDCYYDGGYDCYCVYGHCSPPLDCYDDEDCGTGSLCGESGYGYCDFVQELSNCDEALSLDPIALPLPEGEVASLSFVDLGDEGEALVVGADDGGSVVRAADLEPTPLPPMGAPVQDAIAADLDGDGVHDLVLALPDRLTVLFRYGMDTEQQVDVEVEGGVTDLAVLFNDGIPDRLAMLDGQGQAWWSPAGFNLSFEIPITVSSFASTLDAAALTDVDQDVLLLETPNVGDPTTVHTLDGRGFDIGETARREGRQMFAAKHGNDDVANVVWATTYSDWTMLEALVDGSLFERRALYFAYPYVGVGDFDGDAFDDVALVGGGGLAVVRGDAEFGLGCFAQAPLDSARTRIVAAGDFDGDGIDELAIASDGAAATVYVVSLTP